MVPVVVLVVVDFIFLGAWTGVDMPTATGKSSLILILFSYQHLSPLQMSSLVGPFGGHAITTTRIGGSSSSHTRSWALIDLHNLSIC